MVNCKWQPHAQNCVPPAGTKIRKNFKEAPNKLECLIFDTTTERSDVFAGNDKCVYSEITEGEKKMGIKEYGIMNVHFNSYLSPHTGCK